MELHYEKTGKPRERISPDPVNVWKLGGIASGLIMEAEDLPGLILYLTEIPSSEERTITEVILPQLDTVALHDGKVKCRTRVEELEATPGQITRKITFHRA